MLSHPPCPLPTTSKISPRQLEHQPCGCLSCSPAWHYLPSPLHSLRKNSTQATTTAPPNSASGSASASASGSISGSAAGNATTTSTMTSPLPTAPSTVPGANGGGPGGGAPSPGASAPGGIYGPPDGYIAAADALRSAGMLGFVGFAVGGALVLV